MSQQKTSRPRRRSRRSAAPLFLAVAVIGCGTTSGGNHVPAGVPLEIAGLPIATDRNAFRREWLQPDLDLGRYDRILLVPLELVYSRRFARNHRFQANQHGRAWPPKARRERQRAADITELRELLRAALTAELQRGRNYRLIDEPGPGVLSLSVGVLDLDLDRTRLEMNTTGLTTFDRPQTVTVIASLRDSTTTERLALMLRPQWDYGTTYKSGAGSALWSNVRAALNHWARDFGELLDRSRTQQAATGIVP